MLISILSKIAQPFICGVKSRSSSSFYHLRSHTDTIYALATSLRRTKGTPLAIIRVSGSSTSKILYHLTRLQPLRSIGRHEKGGLSARHATLTRLHNPEDGEILDIGIALWFPCPNSYTGEDACEFHVHGSHAIIKRLMKILGAFEGVRFAEPGEFTRRAVENGKMSLMQAESLPELISAQTDHQRRLALKGLDGTTRAKYTSWIDALVHILAHLEASIDFGEDELIGEQKIVNECVHKLRELSSQITEFVTIARQCRDFIQTGARVSILGRPNAGKSTLMNVLCRQEKSIVSAMDGTTRDVIEHSFELDGHNITICDTAGLKDLDKLPEKLSEMEHSTVMQHHDLIEREGIRRALQVASKADVIIYVVDGSRLDAKGILRALTEELEILMVYLDQKRISKPLHLVINKTDLKTDIDNLDYKNLLMHLRKNLSLDKVSVSNVSCKAEKNIDRLLKELTRYLNEMQPLLGSNEDGDLDYINERHLSLLASTLTHLNSASTLTIKNVDEMAQHVRESVSYLSRIVGTVRNEQIIDVIFRDFCIGK